MERKQKKEEQQRFACIDVSELDDLVEGAQAKTDHVYFVHPSTDISVDIPTDSRPMYRSTYRSSIGRYVDRHIGRESVDMSTEMCQSTYRPMYIGRVMVDISTEISADSRPI